jgi:hypothetical protein
MNPRRLLDRAYQLADQNRTQDAKHVLNAIVFKYPNNIEAWEFYLQLCADKKELDRMVARISESQRILSQTKREIMNYYQFLSKSIHPGHFDLKDFIHSLWKTIQPKLKIVLPLLFFAFLLGEIYFIRSLFSIVIAIELIIFIFAWKGPKEITPLSDFRKFAQDSKFTIKRKKDKTTKKKLSSDRI